MRVTLCLVLEALAFLANVSSAHNVRDSRVGRRRHHNRRQNGAAVTTTTVAKVSTTTRPLPSTTTAPSTSTSPTTTPTNPTTNSPSPASSASSSLTEDQTSTHSSQVASSASQDSISSTTEPDSSSSVTSASTSTPASVSTTATTLVITTTTAQVSETSAATETPSTSIDTSSMSSLTTPTTTSAPAPVPTTSSIDYLTTAITSNSDETTATTSIIVTTTTTSPLAAASTAKLIPVLNPEVNPSDLDNLKPQDSSALYYIENTYNTNPYLSKLFAQMDVNFTYPTVLIENTEFITNADCNSQSTGELTMNIATEAAWQIIVGTWQPLQQMVIILNEEGCGVGNNTRAFWLGHVASITQLCGFFGSCNPFATLTFAGDEIALEQGITDGTLQWGSLGQQLNYTAPTPALTNTKVCGVAGASAPNGIPTQNPCVANFDAALDKAIGVVYTPSAARQTGMAGLLDSADQHQLVVQQYLAVVNAPAPNARRSAPPQITPAPEVGHLDKRHCYTCWLKTVWSSATSTLGKDWSTATSDISSLASVVSTAATDAASEGVSVVSTAIEVFATDVAIAALKFGDIVEDTWADLEQDISQFGGSVASAIANAPSDVANAVDSFNPQGSGTLNINLAPTKLVDSPWGSAYELYKYPSTSSKKAIRDLTLTFTSTSTSASATPSSNVQKSITAYCVGCGVKGTTQYSGMAKFSISGGVQALNFAMTGPLEFNIGLGIDAEIKYTMTPIVVPLIPPQGVPILEIEGVIVIGPVLELDLTINADVYAGGQIIAGSHITVPDFAANFDFANTANSYVRGFDNLQNTKYFAAAGEIGASVTLGMPFSVGVGITLPALKFDKQIKIVNTPAITADAEFEAQFQTGSGAPNNSDSGTCPNGFNYNVTFADNVDLNLFGLYTQPLYEYHAPTLASGCYQIPGTSSQDRRRDTTPNSMALPPGFPATTYSGDGMTTSGNTVSSSGATALYGAVLVVEQGSGLWIVAADDGNMYAQSTSTGATKFQTVDQVGSDSWVRQSLLPQQDQYSPALIVDDQGRGIFLFIDTIEQYSASRVRVLNVDEVPGNAFQTVWGAGVIAGAGSYYWFADPDSAYLAYQPVGCVVTDAAQVTTTKVFAVLDLEQGIGNLTSNTYAVMSSVTGGYVSSCAYLNLF